MKRPYPSVSIRHRFVYVIVWCLATLSLPGQTDPMWQQYHQAQHLITIAQNDSALGVLTALDQDLTDLAGATATPVPDWVRTFRLLIQLERTEALLKKRDNDAATVALLELIDDATAAGTHEITVQAYLRMAQIHQRQQRPRDCRKYLGLAEELIDTHGLDSLTPQFYNRSAAYHRRFGDPALALEYAQRAMTTARELDDTHQLALAHFNLSLYYEETNPRRGEYHLQQAAEYYRHTGSATDYLVMTMVLTGLRIEDGRLQDALVVNDSALVYAGLVVSPDSFFLSRVYDDRATILKTLGRTDSAWHYLQLARAAELRQLETASEDRATEIEAHYLAEKQRDLIARQQEQFAHERSQQQRRYLAFILGMAVVGLRALHALPPTGRQGSARQTGPDRGPEPATRPVTARAKDAAGGGPPPGEEQPTDHHRTADPTTQRSRRPPGARQLGGHVGPYLQHGLRTRDFVPGGARRRDQL